MNASCSRRPLFALVTVLLFFGGAEWLAGRANTVFPTWGVADNPSVVLTGHPTRLWGLSEGVRQNLDTVATVNSLGLRGEVPKLPRPADEERVVILGDSTFFGFGVADQHTMSSVLEGQLFGATTINGGIPGYSTAQTIRLLDEVIWDLEPTLLVVANFWSDTSFEPYRDKDLLATQDVSKSRIFAHSALMRWLATALSGLRAPDRSRIVTWVRGNELPPATQRRVTLDDYAANLDTIIRKATERGIGVMLLTPPSPIEVTGMMEPPHQWDAFRETQASVSRHHGVPHAVASPIFRAAYEENQNIGALFLDDLHPSVAGQAMLASLVRDTLRDADWPAKRLLGTTIPFAAADVVDTTPNHLQGAPDGNNSPSRNLFVDPARSQVDTRPPPTSMPAQLHISIQGGTAPYTVTVIHQGSTVASARVPEARTLALRVPDGEVQVQITDAEGVMQKQTGKAGNTLVGIIFP